MEEKKPSNYKKKRRWLWIPFLVVLLGALIWGFRWASYARPPLDDALAALESDPLLEIAHEPWLTFTPGESEPRTGLIFYPGGRVDPRSYAPPLREIAAEGYLVVVPSMPLNMAIFNPDAADGIMDHLSEIENWAIAGHSVGGTSAAIYSANNTDRVRGLAIWASYPAGSSDLSAAGIPV